MSRTGFQVFQRPAIGISKPASKVEHVYTQGEKTSACGTEMSGSILIISKLFDTDPINAFNASHIFDPLLEL